MNARTASPLLLAAVVCAAGLLASAACGVSLSGDVSPFDAAALDDGSSPKDGASSTGDATNPNPPGMDDAAACDAPTTPGCPCGTRCASNVCTMGGCDPVVFVTETTYKGNFAAGRGDPIAAADGACLAASMVIDRKPLTAFKAWVSTTQSPVAARFAKSTRPYHLLDGSRTVVANDFAALTSNVLHAIDVTEAGLVVKAPPDVWTGTSSTGAAADNDCAQWMAESAPNLGSYGNATFADSRWSLTVEAGDCSVKRHLYCFEQP